MHTKLKFPVTFLMICATMHCIAADNKWLEESSKMNWSEATSSCKSLGASLPTENQMKQEIIACGGVFEGDYWPQVNEANKNYQSCISGKGFAGDYWTSTPNPQTNTCASDVFFRTGGIGCAMKSESLHVRCVAR